MVKALIAGVSEYDINGVNNLPYCTNDIDCFKNTLITELNTEEKNIIVCGKNNRVLLNEFKEQIKYLEDRVEIDDTLILYFSGHGAKNQQMNYLVFTDCFVSVKDIVNVIDNIKCKNKLVIIDSCHSGTSEHSSDTKLDINETAEAFVGVGCAVMASCTFEEKSGFDFDRKISLFTKYVCDAMKYTMVKKGHKSLEDINRVVYRLAEVDKQKSSVLQHANFVSNIVGTILFNVEEYHPYIKHKIETETEEYIISSVEPVHSSVKRYSIKVMLKNRCDEQKIAQIVNEIKDKAIYYEIYENKNAERRFKGKKAKILWFYFGYSIEDMNNSNYAIIATWVDDDQDKSHWYRRNVINNVSIDTNKSYESIRMLIEENTADNNNAVMLYRKTVYGMIELANNFIDYYRDYRNTLISEQELIFNVKSIRESIRNNFISMSDFPFTKPELSEWAKCYNNLAATIADFYYCYDEKKDNGTISDRIIRVDILIKRYHEDLEKIREADNKYIINQQVNL